MATSPLAPWAEVVPNVDRLVTADELLHWPEDPAFPWRYELVAGRLVRMAPTGFEHGEVTQNLGSAMHFFCKAGRLGTVTAAETGYRLPLPGGGETIFAPDIAFTSAARLANQPPPGAPERRRYLSVVPDLVVEVPSPDQYRPEMAAKARSYLTAGVRLVWIVWSARREVDVWRPGDDGPVMTLRAHDQLDGFDVLPGFSYPIVELFS